VSALERATREKVHDQVISLLLDLGDAQGVKISLDKVKLCTIIYYLNPEPTEHSSACFDIML
jgi:hypothetical protein